MSGVSLRKAQLESRAGRQGTHETHRKETPGLGPWELTSAVQGRALLKSGPSQGNAQGDTYRVPADCSGGGRERGPCLPHERERTYWGKPSPRERKALPKATQGLESRAGGHTYPLDPCPSSACPTAGATLVLGSLQAWKCSLSMYNGHFKKPTSGMQGNRIKEKKGRGDKGGKRRRSQEETWPCIT